jgi:hypothetical protein
VSLLQLFIVLHGCLGSPRVATSALASTEGVARRKEVCDSAVEACMRTDVSLLPIVTTHRYYPSLLPIVTTHCRDRGAKKGLLCRDLQAMPNADQRCRRSVGLGDHGHSFLEVRTVGVARNRMVLP